MFAVIPKEKHRQCSLTNLCKASNTSLKDIQTLLGLVATDCVGYHLRGTCYYRGCTKDHTPKATYATPMVNSIVTKLSPHITRITQE